MLTKNSIHQIIKFDETVIQNENFKNIKIEMHLRLVTACPKPRWTSSTHFSQKICQKMMTSAFFRHFLLLAIKSWRHHFFQKFFSKILPFVNTYRWSKFHIDTKYRSWDFKFYDVMLRNVYDVTKQVFWL